MMLIRTRHQGMGFAQESDGNPVTDAADGLKNWWDTNVAGAGSGGAKSEDSGAPMWLLYLAGGGLAVYLLTRKK